MTHQFVESYNEYAAVLLRTDNQLAKEDRWISRCFLTCGFADVESTDELVFAHAESGVQITCDSDALAINAGASSQALRQCYSDLFTVLKNMGWVKVEVHTDADVEEVIADMAAYIPASYDLTMEAGAGADRKALVDDLRAEIVTRQAAQDHDLARSSEAAIPIAALHGTRAVEERPSSPAGKQTSPQTAAVPGDRLLTLQGPGNAAAGSLEEAVRLLAHGQQQVQQQFAGLMALLASSQLGGNRLAQSEGIMEAASNAQAATHRPVEASAEEQGLLDAEQAQESVQARGAGQVTVAPTSTPTSDVGLIPASPDVESDARTSADAIGRVPPHPDDVPVAAVAPAIAAPKEEGLQAGEARALQQPNGSETTNAKSMSAGAAQLDWGSTNALHQPLTDQQQQLISAVTMVVQTALSEVFMLRNAVDRLGGAHTSTGA
ncbi:hypothetical protein ACOTBZ_28730 [Achromobacter xylosoxidans]